MISRKLCLLGAFSVGKTSLLRRFVHDVFDERYLTTLGVKIDTRIVNLDSQPVKMVIWDIEGADPADEDSQLLSTRMKSYVKGTDAVLLVADGTRLSTVEAARRIHDWLCNEYPEAPTVLLLNKSDLTDEWQVDERYFEKLHKLLQVFTTSALSGKNVERTFMYLAELLTKDDESPDGDC